MEHPPTIFAHVVTFNNENTIVRCIESVLEQEGFELGKNLFVRVTDNASRDSSVETITRRFGDRVELLANSINNGFSGAHNSGVSWAISGGADFLLIINPDLRLEPLAMHWLSRALEHDTACGVACPKLYRADHRLEPISPKVFDSTGMFITPQIRHFDRGSNELDRGQYELPEYVFGSSGAAMLLRRAFLLDAVLDADGPADSKQLFDNKFFAYREDADLAWRSQQLGWKTRYEPRAVGYHERHVLPENRSDLAPELNAYSVRNRFLLQLNNFCFGANWSHLPAMAARNLMVIGGVLLKERSSIPALRTAYYLSPRARRIRMEIRRKRRVVTFRIGKWFRAEPYAEPALDFSPAAHPIRSVTAIVVNYNSGDRLSRCVQSLQELVVHAAGRLNVTICVVDNASTDESLQCCRAAIAIKNAVQLIEPGKNLGFAGAINLAANAHPADAFLILNPDVEIGFGALAELGSALDENANLAAVAPLLRGGDNRIQRGYLIRSFPSLGSLAAELFYLHRIWPGNPWTKSFLVDGDRFVDDYLERRKVESGMPHENPARPLIVEQPAAACLLVRAEDFSAIGGFDESFYPAWFEDVDFCKRLRNRGRSCAVVGRAEAYHEGGYAYRLIGGSRFVSIWYPNMITYFRKHESPGRYILLRAMLPIALLVRGCASAISSLAKPEPVLKSEEKDRAGALFRLAWQSVLGK